MNLIARNSSIQKMMK